MYKPQTTEQQQRQAARRVAAARDRIARAKRLGPKETVEAVRVSLRSAVRLYPLRAEDLVDDVADYALARIRELYESEAGP